VVLHPGTYGREGKRIRLRRNGREGRPITFRAAAGRRRPRILGHVRVDGRHIRLKRLLFDGPTGRIFRPTGERAHGEEVQVWIAGRDVTMRQCEVRDNHWHAGVFITADDARLFRNWIHDNGDFNDPGQANLDHGVYWDTGSGGVIADNLIERNLAYGIQLYRRPKDVKVIQNTLVRNGRAGLILAQDTSGVTVANNVVAFNGTEEISFDLAGSDNALIDNLFWMNRTQGVFASDAVSQEGSFAADPRFAGGVTYRLAPGSPAIGRADPRFATAVDFDGRRRPKKRADLGAFEAK
jgi:hypothetical protein